MYLQSFFLKILSRLKQQYEPEFNQIIISLTYNYGKILIFDLKESKYGRFKLIVYFTKISLTMAKFWFLIWKKASMVDSS